MIDHDRLFGQDHALFSGKYFGPTAIRFAIALDDANSACGEKVFEFIELADGCAFLVLPRSGNLKFVTGYPNIRAGRHDIPCEMGEGFRVRAPHFETGARDVGGKGRFVASESKGSRKNRQASEQKREGCAVGSEHHLSKSCNSA